MSQVDAKELRHESLATKKFPAESRADFRLHLAPEVRRGIEQHAKADITVEICGVLVGNWFADENGPYALVSGYIRCENAASKFAEVTFTHESWAQINKEMDSRFANDRIVGWYHTHPDFGIFLSDRDCFIHEHFFSSPGQVAYVIDPVRDLEGIFAWRNGKPTPLAHYWIGDTICTVDASRRNDKAESANQAAAQASAAAYDAANRQPASPFTSGMVPTMIGLLLTFLLGYYYATWRSSWEKQMIIEGTVAHFANTKLVREGFESDVAAVRARVGAILKTFDDLPPPGTELTKEQVADINKLRGLLHENLVVSALELERIQDVYGLTEENRKELAQIAAQKQAELRRITETATKTKPSTAAAASVDKAAEKATDKPAATEKSAEKSAAAAPLPPEAKPPSPTTPSTPPSNKNAPPTTQPTTTPAPAATAPPAANPPK
ncbi:MAG: Mov34/MPN/PAD-1 family protein [Pirellulales bacterium]